MTAPSPADTQYPIPGTGLTAVFLGAGPSGFSPIFYGPGEGGAAMGSVNAGNSDGLYVGGGGINQGFEKAMSPPQDVNQYATRHKALFSQAAGGGSAEEAYDATNPTRFSIVNPELVTKVSGAYDGIAFVDLFGDGLAPNKNAHNAAMVYVAPPLGSRYDSDDAFLKVIEQTAVHVVQCIEAYNSRASADGADLTALKVLRLCLYSSNIYGRPGVTEDQVALAIYAGLLAQLTTDDAGLNTLEFPVAKGEFSAVEKKLMGS